MYESNGESMIWLIYVFIPVCFLSFFIAFFHFNTDFISRESFKTFTVLKTDVIHFKNSPNNSPGIVIDMIPENENKVITFNDPSLYEELQGMKNIKITVRCIEQYRLNKRTGKKYFYSVTIKTPLEYKTGE